METSAIRKSSFAFASTLLPPDTREATRSLYAACRSLDDLADGADPDQAAGCLDQVLKGLSPASLAEQNDLRPEARVFLKLARSHDLGLGAARHLVQTLASDLRPARLQTEAELLAYAQGAAGTVGEMMSDLLCTPGHGEEGRAYAADLGIAMQLTNIARDVPEDAKMGRRYLPFDWCPFTPTALVDPDAASRKTAEQAISRTLALAEKYYARARQGYASLPFRARIVVGLAAERYREIGMCIARMPDRVWSERVRPNGFEVMRCGLRGCCLGVLGQTRTDFGRRDRLRRA